MMIYPCKNCTIKEGYGGDYRCSCCGYTKLSGDNTYLRAKIEKLERENMKLKERNSRLKEEIIFMKKELI